VQNEILNKAVLS